MFLKKINFNLLESIKYNYITENKLSYFSERLKYLNKNSTSGWIIKYTSTLLIWEIIYYCSRLVLIRFLNYKRISKKNWIKLQKDRYFFGRGLHVSSSFRKQTPHVALRLQTRAEDTTMRALCNNYPLLTLPVGAALDDAVILLAFKCWAARKEWEPVARDFFSP